MIGLIHLAPIAAADPLAIEALLDAAFGADRRGRTAYRLRAGTNPIPELSFAALDGDRLIGSLQSWPIQLRSASGVEPLVLVGPVAVAPERQRDGIGKALMQRMLAVADAGAADALMLIGDPEYYDRLFGFSASATAGWDLPGPVERHRLLARMTGGRTLSERGLLGPCIAPPQYRAA